MVSQEQVQRLRVDINEAELKNHSLSIELETTKRCNTELSQKFNLLSENMASLEAKLLEKTEELFKVQRENLLLVFDFLV